MEHLVNDLLHCRLQAWTFPAGIEARWLGEGILQLLPTAPWRQATILSAGVHGNETAPIELQLQLTHDLSQGRQPLTQALLIVFGNLPAIRAARRYLHNDLNRLFGGAIWRSPRGMSRGGLLRWSRRCRPSIARRCGGAGQP